MPITCAECGKVATLLCECTRTAYCSSVCQRKNSPYHFLNCKIVRKTPQWKSVYPDFLRSYDTRLGVKSVSEYATPPAGKFTQMSEYQNMFEALEDIRNEKGERIFSWYADCVKESKLWSDAAKEGSAEEDANFTGFIPDNNAISQWASDIGIAEAESEFNADYDDPGNVDRGETIRQIRENTELQLILGGHLTPDILPPTRGIETGLTNKWFSSVFRTFRNEALEPLGPDGLGGREGTLDPLPRLKENTEFMNRYGALEIRKVFDGELQQRRELLKNEDLSPYRVKFQNRTATADIVFGPMHTFRVQNAYIYRIDNVLGKPARFFQRRVYRDPPDI